MNANIFILLKKMNLVYLMEMEVVKYLPVNNFHLINVLNLNRQMKINNVYLKMNNVNYYDVKNYQVMNVENS